ncbi:MAG: helix-turn-helix transcriptional regulator [Crocinitomicaceae bacterium]|nr:helix-turn-helix transcriptional regulator [Crocinitomicaceae bacterium]MBK8926443.1 helix-turn-helix transcriptional regulator [Crocinitomicaceae bacterium]
MHKVRDEKILRRFGENLRKIRKSKGMSQEDLAYESDLTLSQIARIETGRLNTSICTVYAIAKGLGVDAKELM